jgi:hypothetical protein
VQGGAVAGGVAEGRDIEGDHRAGAENRRLADLDELVDADEGPDDDVVLKGHVAAELGPVGENVTPSPTMQSWATCE